MDESVRAVPIVPHAALPYALDLFGEQVRFIDSPLPAVTSLRLRLLVSQVRPFDVDLVHVLDCRLARPAASAARSLGVPMVCSCWSLDDAHAIAGRGDAATVTVPTQAMADQLDRDGSGAASVIEHVPPGTPRLDDLPEPLADVQQSLCVLVIATGQPSDPVVGLLRAIAAVRDSLGPVQVFIYCTQTGTHRLWKIAQKLDLLGLVNLVNTDPGSQRLLMRSDVIMIPEALDYHRSIVPMAMASGRPIIAAANPLADYLVDGQTARIAADVSERGWTGHLERLIDGSRELRTFGEQARDFAREHFGVSAFIRRTLDAYRRATGEPFSFDQAAEQVEAGT
mgnify:FL=1